MAIGDVINGSAEYMPEIVTELGRLGNWLQAIGIIVLLWLIFQIVNLVINLKRKNHLKDMKDDIRRIEKKVDNLLRKKK